MTQISKQPDPFVGQIVIDGVNSSVVVTAAKLVSVSTPCSGVEITALPANTQDVYVGSSTSQNRKLVPGETLFIPIDDMSKIYVKSSSGTQAISYFATY